MRVETFLFGDVLLNYDPNEDGEFTDYITDEWDGKQFEQLAAEINRMDELAQKEQRIDELEAEPVELEFS